MSTEQTPPTKDTALDGVHFQLRVYRDGEQVRVAVVAVDRRDGAGHAETELTLSAE